MPRTFSSLRGSIISAVLIAALVFSCLPARQAQAVNYFVDTLVDENDGSCSDGDCSLRDAIGLAGDNDTIYFSVTGTITLAGTELEILESISILGPGAASLTVNGDSASRVFKISPTAEVSIAYLTISGGFHSSSGGGIDNEGDTIITNAVIDSNNATWSGGGITNSGTLLIETSTIKNNTTSGGGVGGGITNNPGGTLTIKNSTISGNSAGGAGGIWTEDSTTTLIYTTVSNNSAGDGGGLGIQEDPGETTELYLNSSLIAGNIQTSGSGTEDCYADGVSYTSQDYNLTGSGTGCSLGGGNDQTSSSPGLLALADNGGGTETHALGAASPALNQIPSGVNGCGTTYSNDQRGISRPQGSTCDIGAYEVEPPQDPDNPGFYVPSGGKWYLKNDQANGWSNFVTVKFAGPSGALAVSGDWDNNWVDTPGFYVPSGGKWYLKNDQLNGWSNFVTVKFPGPSGAVPVAGDWDNDRVDTPGFYVPSAGKWYLKNDQANGWSNFITVKFPGPSGAIPVVGDWNADGDDTIGFYVPSGGKWYLKNDLVNGWSNFVTVKFPGPSGAQALGGDWDADGTDTIGFYVPSGGKWYLKNDQVNGWSNFSTVKFAGPSGSQAVAGDWQ